MRPARRLSVFFLPLALSAAVHFEPNRGQAPASARYVANGARSVVLFTDDGPVFASSTTRIAMTLGGSHRGHADALDPLPGRSNYLTSGIWRSGVPHFARLSYSAVYPGIDLVFRGAQDAMEYDFDIAPAADPLAIRIRFSGAESVRIEDGSLIVRTAGLELRHRRLAAWQEWAGTRRPVDVRYRIENGVVSFMLGAYDRTLPLVIDPVLEYATYLGGAGNSSGAAIAVDSAGNMYVAGSSTVAAVHATTVMAGLIAKVDPTGASVSNTYITGTSDTAIYGMSLDASGNIVVAGQTATAGALKPSSGAYQTANATGFVAKFAPGASAPIFTSTFAAGPTAVAVDHAGNICVAGSAAAGYPTTTGALQPANAGGLDVFVLKLTADGSTAAFATYLGGSADDLGQAIAVDASGNILVTGGTSSANFPLASAAQSKFGGLISVIGSPTYGDAFVAKLDPTGATLLYSTFLGGSGPDVAYGIAVDAAGHAYVTGGTSSANFPTTAGTSQTAYGGPAADPVFPFSDGDAFVAKYSSAGALLWSTLLGGSSYDSAAAVTLDATGNVYVTGAFGSTDFPLTANSIPNCRMTSGPFVAEFDPTGSKLLASTGLSGMGFDQGNAIALDSTGLVYIAGSAASEVFFTTPNAAQSVYGGGNFSAFAAKVSLTAPPSTFVACVLNAASFQPGNQSFFPLGTVAPGEIISIFGLGLGPSPAIPSPQVVSGAVTTLLGGTQVFFDGIPAPLIYAGPTQINAIVPYGANPKNITPPLTQMTVVRGASTYGPVPMPLAPAVPGIFSYDGSGAGQALVLNQDTSLNTASNPAARGSVITFYAEGGGLLTPPTADGELSSQTGPWAATQLQVSVTVRGTPAQVLYAGVAPGYVSGLLQIDAVVPTTIDAGSNVPLFIMIGTVTSQNGLTIAVN